MTLWGFTVAALSRSTPSTIFCMCSGNAWCTLHTHRSSKFYLDIQPSVFCFSSQAAYICSHNNLDCCLLYRLVQ